VLHGHSGQLAELIHHEALRHLDDIEFAEWYRRDHKPLAGGWEY
jgi:hypothetical protein